MKGDLKKLIYGFEISLLKPRIRSSVKELDLLLADDFKEFGSSGNIYTKKMVLKRLPKDSQRFPAQFIVSDFEIKELATTIILTTFKTDKILPDKKHVFALRASLWRKNNENWQIIFHQGTVIQ